ncbi:MAG: response regulator [Bacteroidota bacterium]
MTNQLPRILHVEDDQIDRMVVQRLLGRFGLAEGLLQAGNGLEALELLSTAPKPFPRAILLDINMPKMNGIEFLQQIRQDPLPLATRIYMLTTSTDERDRKSTFELGVAGYFVKPIDMSGYEMLFETLKSFWSLNQWP